MQGPPQRARQPEVTSEGTRPPHSDARCSEGPPDRGVWHRQGPRKREWGSGRGEHDSLGERQGWGDPTGLIASGAQARPPCPPRLRCRRTLFTRTRRPSAASCALWPPTATSTGPRPTAGASAPPSGRCCTSLRCVRRGAWPRAGAAPHPTPRPPGTAAQPSPGPSHLQGGECEEETIRFGLEVLYVDSWARRRVYAAFKDALGSGMHHHLQVGGQTGRGHPWGGATRTRAHGLLGPQNNELLRDIFGLGPVLVLDAAALKACKISRFEKVRPLSLPLHCFGLASSRGLEEGPGRRLPLSRRPHSLPPPPAPVQRGGLQSQDQGTQPRAGQAGRRPVSRLSASSPVFCFFFFNRRPYNTWSLPGLVAFIFLMTKPKRDTGLGWADWRSLGTTPAPHSLFPVPGPWGQAEGRAFLRPVPLE